MSDPDYEDWLIWLELPITKWVLAKVREDAEFVRKAFMDYAFDAPGADLTMMANMRGQYGGLLSVLNHEYARDVFAKRNEAEAA